MIEIEVQNETHQSQHRLRFAAVPRIGEGLRLREKSGMWASYDVLDVWYQKADFGDVWIPFVHVRMTAGEATGDNDDDGYDREFDDEFAMRSAMANAPVRGMEPFKI